MKTFLLLIFAVGLWAQAPIAGPVVSGGGGGGGTGCVPAGTANKIPTTDGSGGCNVTGVNIDGSNNVTGFATITAGNGQSITYTGTGIINASKILGTTLTSITGMVWMNAGIPAAVTLTTTGTSGAATFSGGDIEHPAVCGWRRHSWWFQYSNPVQQLQRLRW